MPGILSRMWDRVAKWFDAAAEHVTVEFIPEPGRPPVAAYGGYLRLFLAEGFISKAKTWGNEHFPALHGGASLTFLGGSTPFTTFARPPGSWEIPGAQLDFPLTPLLPFNGGVVEVEAALYQASTAGPLATAIQIVGSFSSLLGPPLQAAAEIASKVADGIDTVLAEDKPVLGVHWSMVGMGGGGNVLRSGSLAVVGKPRKALPGPLSISNGSLCLDAGHGPEQLVDADYLVLRIECRTERDDWRFPELDALIRAAGSAYINGYLDESNDRRTDAIARAWNSPDLIPADRIRVAKLVADEIDSARQLHAVPGPDRSLGAIAPQSLPARDAPELKELTLGSLLAL
jgi:hypothetical protein